jgi:hypothetical protein
VYADANSGVQSVVSAWAVMKAAAKQAWARFTVEGNVRTVLCYVRSKLECRARRVMEEKRDRRWVYMEIQKREGR